MNFVDETRILDNETRIIDLLEVLTATIAELKIRVEKLELEMAASE